VWACIAKQAGVKLNHVHPSLGETVLLEFFSKGVARETKQIGSLTDVALAAFEGVSQERRFYGADHHVVDGVGLGITKALKIEVERCNQGEINAWL
jgi:hypothetical protein